MFDNFDWDGFTENVREKWFAFVDGLFNISTWLEEAIRPTKRAADLPPVAPEKN